MSDLSSPPVAQPLDLLASILSSFGTLPPKVKKVRSPVDRRKADPLESLPLPLAFSARKTGYRIWKATARVLQVQPQICNCCGHENSFIKAEFFALENGNAHATWLRPEGYGIEAPEDLPIQFVDLEPTFVPACPVCRDSALDTLDLLFSPKQLSLPL